MKSLLIKDTTKEEREEIIRESLDCGGGGCENCSSCGLGEVLLGEFTKTTLTEKKNSGNLTWNTTAGLKLLFQMITLVTHVECN